MKTHFRVLAGCLSIVIIGLAACSSSSAPEASLTPVMANPPPEPVPVLATEPAAVTAIPDTARPVPTAGVTENTGSVVSTAIVNGSAAVPSVNDPWLEIKDDPFERRSDFVARADSSISLLNGSVSVARLSPPKPDMADAHTNDIKSLDASMTALSQARATLTSVSADGWESAKNDFHSAWQNAQAACAQARASGN